MGADSNVESLSLPAVSSNCRFSLAGHWVVNGSGIVVNRSDSEQRFAGREHPLHEVNEAPLRTFGGHLHSGGSVQASNQEETETVVWV